MSMPVTHAESFDNGEIAESPQENPFDLFLEELVGSEPLLTDDDVESNTWLTDSNVQPVDQDAIGENSQAIPAMALDSTLQPNTIPTDVDTVTLPQLNLTRQTSEQDCSVEWTEIMSVSPLLTNQSYVFSD